MNILDENVPKSQRQLLESWGIPVRQIGFNVGRRGLQDDEIEAARQLRRRLPVLLGAVIRERDMILAVLFPFLLAVRAGAA